MNNQQRNYRRVINTGTKMIDKNELKVEFEDKIDSVMEQLSNCIRDINFILDVELPELKLIVNKME